MADRMGTDPSNQIAIVKQQLKMYQQLGVQAVVVHIKFPLLCPQFFSSKIVNNPKLYNQFLAYYQQVVQLCHQSGIKVLAETTSKLSGWWRSWCRSLPLH